MLDRIFKNLGVVLLVFTIGLTVGIISPIAKAEQPIVPPEAPAPEIVFVYVTVPAISVDEKEAEPEYTPEEIELLERVVMSEAGNQPYEGKMAVAEVILNRLRLEWDGCKTLTEVLIAPNQFASPYCGEVNVDVKHAVQDATAGIWVFDVPVIGFHAAYVHPSWADMFTLAGQIGDHKFYYKED